MSASHYNHDCLKLALANRLWVRDSYNMAKQFLYPQRDRHQYLSAVLVFFAVVVTVGLAALKRAVVFEPQGLLGLDNLEEDRKV